MRPDDLPFPNSPVIPTHDAQFSSIEKRIRRIHRLATIGAVLVFGIGVVLLGGVYYVVNLLLSHFGVI